MGLSREIMGTDGGENVVVDSFCMCLCMPLQLVCGDCYPQHPQQYILAHTHTHIERETAPHTDKINKHPIHHHHHPYRRASINTGMLLSRNMECMRYPANRGW